VSIEFVTIEFVSIEFVSIEIARKPDPQLLDESEFFNVERARR